VVAESLSPPTGAVKPGFDAGGGVVVVEDKQEILKCRTGDGCGRWGLFNIFHTERAREGRNHLVCF